jgi:hypothetical protein
VTLARRSPRDCLEILAVRGDKVITGLNFVDVGDEGASLGPEIVFSNKLLKGGQEVGHEGAVCTTVSLVRNEAQCIATFSFQGGQITARRWFAWCSGTPRRLAPGSPWMSPPLGVEHVLRGEREHHVEDRGLPRGPTRHRRHEPLRWLVHGPRQLRIDGRVDCVDAVEKRVGDLEGRHRALSDTL